MTNPHFTNDMACLQEHPHWTPPEEVIIPEGFKDYSWKNDACPSWFNPSLNVMLWIDYPQADSEFGETETFFRFCVVSQAMREDDLDDPNPNSISWPCETWDQVLEILARCQILKVPQFFNALRRMAEQIKEHDQDSNEVNYRHRVARYAPRETK